MSSLSARPPQGCLVLGSLTVFVAIGGPRSVGKSTLVQAVCACYPDQFARPMSYTTRPQRDNSADRYFEFVTVERFRTLEREGDMLQVDSAYGHNYGISRTSFELLVSRGIHPIHEVSHRNQERFEDAGYLMLRVAVERAGVFGDSEWPSDLAVLDSYHVVISMDQSPSGAAAELAAKTRAHTAWSTTGIDVRRVDQKNRYGYRLVADEFTDEDRPTTAAFHAVSSPYWDYVFGELRPGARIVELGAGTGWLTAGRELSYFDYTAVDIVPQMVAGSSSQTNTIVGTSMRQLPFPARSFDVALASLLDGAMYSLLLAELRRVMRDGGHLYVTLPSFSWASVLRGSPSRLPYTSFALRTGQEVVVYSLVAPPSEIASLLEVAGFELVDYRELSGDRAGVEVSAPAILDVAAAVGCMPGSLGVVDAYIARAV